MQQLDFASLHLAAWLSFHKKFIFNLYTRFGNCARINYCIVP